MKGRATSSAVRQSTQQVKILALWEPGITNMEHWDTDTNQTGTRYHGALLGGRLKGRQDRDGQWGLYRPCTGSVLLRSLGTLLMESGAVTWTLSPAAGHHRGSHAGEPASGAGNAKWSIPGGCNKETGVLGTLCTQEVSSPRGLL